MRFERGALEDIERYPAAAPSIFQTRQWLEFLAETQRGEPVVLSLVDGDVRVGIFTGLLVRRFGVRILGSPFPGWTTPFMGFRLSVDIPSTVALTALQEFAFRELGCLHVEIADRGFRSGEALPPGWTTGAYETYQSDLRLSEESLFAAMESACRRCIRKAEKSGVHIEVASGDGFADEYYEQLQDVFDKQGLVPTYGRERVRALVRHLMPTGHLLLLRARSPDGTAIGTGIYSGLHEVAHFWGNASWRIHQHWRPNEALHWYAMRYLKARGASVFDWGGLGTYKEKYGVQRVDVPWVRRSRFKVLGAMRDRARAMVYLTQRAAGALRARSGAGTGALPAKPPVVES